MFAYIGRRLLATIPVMAVVAVFVFMMLRLASGDPAAIIAGNAATAQDIVDIRQKLGLDRPIVTQFFIWLGHVLTGDFGESFFYKKQVADIIADRAGPTLALAACTLVISVLIAVPLGSSRHIAEGHGSTASSWAFRCSAFRCRCSSSATR